MTAEWIDLGNGEAIAPRRVRGLSVVPPWPPSALRVRAFLEQLSWTVIVHDDRTSVVHTVACYPAEGGARAHARRIVAAMLREADAA